MNKIIKNLLLISIPLAASVFFFAGCKKEITNPAQTNPVIKEIFPGSAIAKAPIVIKGLNLQNVSKVQFGTRVVTDFNAATNTDSTVSVKVPDSLPLGETFVQVYMADGKGYSAYKFTVLLTPPVPKIASVTPTTALPGDVLTIVGINFMFLKFSDVIAE